MKPPGREIGPAGNRTDHSNLAGSDVVTRLLGGYDIELFTRRVVADCLNNALAWQWRRRADQFEAACSRPGDRPGRGGDQQERDSELRAVALGCRAKAAMIEAGWLE